MLVALGTATASVAATAAAASASVASTIATAPTGLEAVIVSTVPGIAAAVLPSGVTTTAPVTSVAVQIAPALEVTAAFAGGLAGGLTGVSRHLDLTGVATLAVVGGLGGGIIRDVLLQKYGIYALENPALLIAALIAALVAFFFFEVAGRVGWALFLIDALTLGLFASLGSDKALLAGLTVVPAVLLGTITGVGGGVLRDVLTTETPQVLLPGGYYAIAAATGSILYVSLVGWLNVVKPIALVATVVIVLAMRVLSKWLGWQSPTPTDLTPVVAAAPGHALRTGRRAVRRLRRIPTAPEGPKQHDSSAEPPKSAGREPTDELSGE